MNYNYPKIVVGFSISILLNIHSTAQKTHTQVKSNTAIATDTSDSANVEDSISSDTSVYKNEVNDYQDSILKWKRMREFSYMAYIDSLLKKRKNLRIDTVTIDQNDERKSNTRVLSNDNSASENLLNSLPVKIFFWILAIAFIGFVLFKLFFSGGLFQRSNAKVTPEIIDEQPEQLNEYSKYNLLISHAEFNNDYNLAIRYLYLQSLKRLADRNLISFSPDKTNNDYVRELSSHNYKNEFAFLTRQYEYSWYGKFNIDKHRYSRLKDEFISFNKKV
jgi:Domain of unknown function (DUF4129)